MSEPLNTAGVSKRYDGRTVLDQVTLSLEPGKITALLGGSGAGKSTLLRLLAGFERVDAGEIRLGARVLSSPAFTEPPERRRIGLIFQDFALFPHLNAVRNVAFGLKHLGRVEAEARAREWIGLLGLTDRANAFPHELSGGEQQRVAIARALAPKPDAILMDEPFSGLDPLLSESVREAALSAVRAAGIPALMVTHDPAEALSHADRIAILQSGRLLQSGAADTVYRRPASLAAARALGFVNVLSPDKLPAGAYAGPPATQIGFRPEAARLDPASPLQMRVDERRLAGPMVRLVLTGAGVRLIALVAHAGAPQAGGTVGIRLDPDFTFTIPSGEI